MSTSGDPVAGMPDVDVQTDVPRMRDASTQTDAREINPGPDKSLVVPSIPSAACPVKPEVSVRIVNGKRIVELLGCGNDRRGRYRPPYRSTHKVIMVTIDTFWPPRHSKVIAPNTTNMNILLRALNYLLGQKCDAVLRHRSENPDCPLEHYTRQIQKYEDPAVREAAWEAARMPRPQSSSLKLDYINNKDELVSIPNGGRLIFIRRRSDGWTVFHEPVENVAVECVRKNDICLWECEEAMDEIYHWCRDMLIGCGPPYNPSSYPDLLKVFIPGIKLDGTDPRVRVISRTSASTSTIPLWPVVTPEEVMSMLQN
ncbi:hypothetical protein F5Y00DRAFT_268156 [Daldinia vernicosa]|uniref:uncharacterized protein n=1 Tax=Daldinia vernicosa TaxID=114800 RepID=UPI002007989A|nr:uncharacterized protein F5Y00DRAFT_268156 [Daldinia vernicosa]KAI0850724.1 hypothetical protein F5Y00DRAFT_268156 [Daldinia vernicosa]